VRNFVSEIGDGSRGGDGERETSWRKDSKKSHPGALTNFGVRLRDVTAGTTHLHVKVSLFRLLQFRDIEVGSTLGALFSEKLLTTQPHHSSTPL
jgi:hypothetical protein